MMIRSLVVYFLFLPVLAFTQQIVAQLLDPLNLEIAQGAYPKVNAIIVQHGSDILLEKYLNGFAAANCLSQSR